MVVEGLSKFVEGCACIIFKTSFESQSKKKLLELHFPCLKGIDRSQNFVYVERNVASLDPGLALPILELHMQFD